MLNDEAGSHRSFGVGLRIWTYYVPTTYITQSNKLKNAFWSNFLLLKVDHDDEHDKGHHDVLDLSNAAHSHSINPSAMEVQCHPNYYDLLDHHNYPLWG